MDEYHFGELLSDERKDREAKIEQLGFHGARDKDVSQTWRRTLPYASL
jgi:hypothetical protein